MKQGSISLTPGTLAGKISTFRSRINNGMLKASFHNNTGAKLLNGGKSTSLNAASSFQLASVECSDTIRSTAYLLEDVRSDLHNKLGLIDALNTEGNRDVNNLYEKLNNMKQDLPMMVLAHAITKGNTNVINLVLNNPEKFGGTDEKAQSKSKGMEDLKYDMQKKAHNDFIRQLREKSVKKQQEYYDAFAAYENLDNYVKSLETSHTEAKNNFTSMKAFAETRESEALSKTHTEEKPPATDKKKDYRGTMPFVTLQPKKLMDDFTKLNSDGPKGVASNAMVQQTFPKLSQSIGAGNPFIKS